MATYIWVNIGLGKGLVPSGSWINADLSSMGPTGLIESVLGIDHYKVFKNYIFENTVISSRGQRVDIR